MYTPDTRLVGTVQDADSSQFPQSTSPVLRPLTSLLHWAGWVRGVGVIESTFRAPAPL